MKKAVLITGASTGIGKEATLRLARKGCYVFAGVRNQDAARALEQSLEADAKGAIEAVQLDVTKPKSVEKALKVISEKVGADGLIGLVNNAGIAVAGPIEVVPMEKIQEQFEVNVFGAIRMTQAALPLLRHGKGRIVNMSSISGRIATPGLGIYSASKFALEAVSDALRRELLSQNLHVALVEPGPIRTPIWEKAEGQSLGLKRELSADHEKLYGDMVVQIEKVARKTPKKARPASDVADAVAHALLAEKPKSRYLVGGEMKAVSWLANVAPDAVLDRLLMSQFGLRRR